MSTSNNVKEWLDDICEAVKEVAYGPETDFDTIKDQMLIDFPGLSMLADYQWDTIKYWKNNTSQFSEKTTMLCFSMRIYGDTYHWIGIYPAGLNMQLVKGEKSYGGYTYSWAYFPDGVEQFYKCVFFQGRSKDTWSEETSVRNKYIFSSSYFSSVSPSKAVDYGVYEVPDINAQDIPDIIRNL
jgi:hypothetical protein